MKRFKLLAIALVAVVIMGAVGCTSTRYPVEEPYGVNYGLDYYSPYYPYYYGGRYYSTPRTYIRTYPVEHERGWHGRGRR